MKLDINDNSINKNTCNNKKDTTPKSIKKYITKTAITDIAVGNELI
jgi:hypothetical protein